MVTVYLDVLFCVNMIVDYMMLLTVRRLMYLSAKRRRLLLGAALGGIGSFVILLPPVPFPLYAAVGILQALTMTAAAFLPMGKKRFICAAMLLFGVSFLYSGSMLAVTALFSPRNTTVRNGAVYIGISPLMLVGLTLGFYFVFRLFGRIFGRTGSRRCRVKIRIGERTVEGEGLADTGNKLREPFSGLPVIVVRRGLLNDKEFAPDVPEGADIKNRPDLRMIPYSSVGGGGVLTGLKPDEIMIENEGDACQVSAYIALSGEKGFSDGCDMIVPAELIMKGS